jgi:hypothetical protein
MVTNWAACDIALRQRGRVTVWFSEATIAAWKPSHPPRAAASRYLALAIATALTLRAVFRLALARPNGAASVIRMQRSLCRHVRARCQAQRQRVRRRSATGTCGLSPSEVADLSLCAFGRCACSKISSSQGPVRDNWGAPKRLDSGAESNLLKVIAAGVYARYTGCAYIADPGCLATQTKGATLMPLSVEDFYRSSNGDRWQLIRDTTSGVSFVRHSLNLI